MSYGIISQYYNPESKLGSIYVAIRVEHAERTDGWIKNSIQISNAILQKSEFCNEGCHVIYSMIGSYGWIKHIKESNQTYFSNLKKCIE